MSYRCGNGITLGYSGRPIWVLMLTFRTDTFAAPVPAAAVWPLADCMEFRGKQDLWAARRPEVLAVLREQAIVQSVESSNRIEGVTVAADRLRPLVLGNARPRDRSEEELAGYRRALEWVFGQAGPIRVDARVLLHLHAMAQGGMSGDAGRFKSRDDEIIEARPGVGRVVRFRPTPAADTPAAVDALCRAYAEAIDAAATPSLLLVATFVFDFLCVHPFRDGNGRVSRLLTSLLLQQHGFVVGRYVSLERLVESSKEDYYRVLADCSRGWSEGRNPIAPWWTYFLTVVRRGYAEFADRVERPVVTGGTKTDLVRRVVLGRVGRFTLAEVGRELPAVSGPLLRKVLATMKSEGRVVTGGRGRGAWWEVRTPEVGSSDVP